MLLANTKEESYANNTVAKCFPPQRLLPTHVASITPSKDGLFFPQLATRKSQLSLLGRKPNGEMGRTTARTAIGREEGKHGAYYDAKIGRFLQQDSMAFPNQIQGMNRMMYVQGKPLHFADHTGKNLSAPLANALLEYFLAPEGEKEAAFVYGFFKGKQIEKEEKRNKYHQKVYKFLDRLANTLITAGTIAMTYGALASGPFAPLVFTVGLFMTAAGVIVKCAASGYKANFMDKNSSDSTYLSYSYSNPPSPGQENKPGPRPPDTRTLVQTSQAEKEDAPPVACSGG